VSGEATIQDRHTVVVGDRKLRTRNIILALGAEPAIPAIEGLREINPLTSDNIWSLRELPRRLVVLGGGPIGCELAQAMARLDSQVTQVEMGARLLPREDEDVSSLVSRALAEDGVNIRVGQQAVKFEKTADGVSVTVKVGTRHEQVLCDQVLVAVGRKPRTDGVDWAKLGINLRSDGTIATDPFLCANRRNIFAVGDCTGPMQFTHFASHQAYYAVVNSLFSPIRFRANYRVIPRVTYTEPEVASVGLNESSAKAAGSAYSVIKYGLDDLDRAITDSEDRGFVKVLVDPRCRKGSILGATVVGHSAGETLSELTAAMQHGFGMAGILGTVHPYPTMSEGNRYAAGIWKKARTQQWVLGLLEKLHRWRR
jgi:pyruvate/2-oxoglutarate dehydrogenase complex dihydrolipoamide dehydrogenase (E3) component